MAKIVGVFVCLFIMALDITAGILGIQAEAAQNQVSFACLLHTSSLLVIIGFVSQRFEFFLMFLALNKCTSVRHPCPSV